MRLRVSRHGWLTVWAAGAVVFAALAVWARRHALFPGEQALTHWLQEHRLPGELRFEEFADLIGYPTTMIVMAVGGTIVFLALRRWELAALAVVAPMLTRIGPVMKDLVARPRPAANEVPQIREHPGGFSFPSGHSLQASIICAVIIIAAQELLPGRLRRAVQLIAATLALTIGWERVFDGAHWPTDVVAGLLLGTLCTFAAWAVIRRVAQMRREPARA
jgi:undecaprenyl-diphosphatase